VDRDTRQLDSLQTLILMLGLAAGDGYLLALATAG
jgi:hypothetical protein